MAQGVKRIEGGLTYDRAAELLHYDPATGVITCRVRRGNLRVGDEVGTITDDGYRDVCIDRRHHPAHRLAWLLSFGHWPSGIVDHKNGIRDDNRLENLRDTVQMHNTWNSRKPSSNTSGVKGVYWNKNAGKFQAQLRDGGSKRRYLGLFDTIEEAADAVRTARAEAHGTFARNS